MVSRVRTGKIQKPSKASLPPPVLAGSYTFPAPTRGWILNENLAVAQPGGAAVLDNWIPTTKGIKARGGNAKYATLGGSVTGMFSYKSGGSEIFFGATTSAIYNISAPATPTTIPATSVSGLTGGEFTAQMFTTSGGDFLYVVNGVDKPQLFNGSTWTAIDGASTPAITGVTTTTLSFVWTFGSRLWFVQKDTTKAWYLPAASLGGAATQFELGAVFTRGGSLLFGGSWSMDSGAGLDDKCIFVSTEGEVVIYQGTDPASTTTWSKVGVYQITQPVGKNATMRAGGDILIATKIGLVPVSAAVNADVGALDMSAVSRTITPYWQSMVANLGGFKPQILKWPEQNIFLISQPQDAAGSWLLGNLITGAWARGTGMVTNCLGSFGSGAYFGSTDSCVYKMESGGFDNAASYTCKYLGQHDQMGAGWQAKTIEQVRPVFSAGTPIAPLVSAKSDYNTTLSPPPGGIIYTADGTWDFSTWDVTLWDSGSSPVTSPTQWKQVGVTGFAIAPEVQITIANIAAPSVELIAIEATFRAGAIVT